jgi:hypothetical protein
MVLIMLSVWCLSILLMRYEDYLRAIQRASIMASATPSASVPGTRHAAPEERDAGRLPHHVEGPKMAAAVAAAARRSSLPRFASNDHVCTRTHSNLCIPSPSVANVRYMLESCDNRARREKTMGKWGCRRYWRHVMLGMTRIISSTGSCQVRCVSLDVATILCIVTPHDREGPEAWPYASALSR